MITKGARTKLRLEQALDGLRQLTERAYSLEDIKAIIEPVSSNIELFLKSTVHIGVHPRSRFADLIQMLLPLGISLQSVTALDDLRDCYNALKHQPAAAITLSETIGIVRGAVEAIEEINRNSLGSTGQKEQVTPRYYLWVAFWDHYVHGDTTVAILIPGGKWPYGKTVDHINVEISGWEQIKAALLATGNFRLGENHIPKEVWSSFLDESDFLNAGVWDGSYRELVTILATYEKKSHRNDLLPGLRRQEAYWSVGTGLIMAALDALACLPLLDRDAFRVEVLKIADNVFAVPSKADGVSSAVDQLYDLLQTIPLAEQRLLSGPLILPESTKKLTGPLNVWIEEGAIALGSNIPEISD